LRPNGTSGTLLVPEGRQLACWKCDIPVEHQGGELYLCTRCGHLWTTDVNLALGYSYHARLEWDGDSAKLLEAVLHVRGEPCTECELYRRAREYEKDAEQRKWLKEYQRTPTNDGYDIDMGP